MARATASQQTRLRGQLELQPRVIARNDVWVPDARVAEGLDDDDLGAVLRERRLDSIDDIRRAVLEQDGSLSIAAVDGTDVKVRNRRRRYRRHV